LYEPFWLEANSAERAVGEAWTAYAARSCEEVRGTFDALVESTDFQGEARKFGSLGSSFQLLFNAYFVTETQLSAIGLRT
jgi:hypothetical protein